MCVKAVDKKIEQALSRLQKILPLKQRQAQCPASVRRLHQAILTSFVDNGRPLNREEMMRHVNNPDEAVKVLSEGDMVTVNEDNDLVGAYPFTMQAREHKVQVNGHNLFAMCALDALAISPMFDMKVLIRSSCRETGAPLEIKQDIERIENPESAGAICFGIDWGAAGAGDSCSAGLCMEMVYLKEALTAQCWLEKSSQTREIFTLPQAIEFASRFFVPLLV